MFSDTSSGDAVVEPLRDPNNDGRGRLNNDVRGRLRLNKLLLFSVVVVDASVVVVVVNDAVLLVFDSAPDDV